MPKCVQCGSTRYLGACICCKDQVCADCKAGPSTDAVSAPFDVYCSEDCRDGTHMRLSMRLKDCPKCRGTGKDVSPWARKVGSGTPDCWHCDGKGQILPPLRPIEGPMAPADKHLETCPTCMGRYQLNCATCLTCSGQGVVAV